MPAASYLNLFLSFQTWQFLRQIYAKRCPSRDSNPRPSTHETHPMTTRPGVQCKSLILSMLNLFRSEPSWTERQRVETYFYFWTHIFSFQKFVFEKRWEDERGEEEIFGRSSKNISREIFDVKKMEKVEKLLKTFLHKTRHFFAKIYRRFLKQIEFNLI